MERVVLRCMVHDEPVVERGGVIGGGCDEAVEDVEVVEDPFFFLMLLLVWTALNAFACFRNNSFCFRKSLI